MEGIKIEPTEPLAYLESLLDNITNGLENDDSEIRFNQSDLVNLKHAIKTFKYNQETIRIYKVVDGFVKEESKKVKHIFPLENTAGYGQLCDKVVAYEKAFKAVESALKGFAQVTGDKRFTTCVKKAKDAYLND